MSAIWQLKTMKAVQHRLIWWLIDVGAVGKAARHGWQRSAAAQLGIHRITINRQVQLLVELGVLREGKKKGEVSVNPSCFVKTADKTGLRIGDDIR